MLHDRTGLDWSLLRSFLAVAEEGSLSGAARRLGQTQPTLGRQIHTLEEELGAPLFQRHARGLSPTEVGLELLPAAREMKAAAARLALAAEGQAASLAGVVRMTASVVVSHAILPPLVARLRQQEPAIEIELVPTDTTENLLYREADLAIRMYRPQQLDLVARHVGDAELGLYASTEYLARRGMPQTEQELLEHEFVGFDRSELIIDAMRSRGWEVDRSFFGVRCDDQSVYWELGRAGCGIVATQVLIGDRDPCMRRVTPDFSLGALPFWIAVPQALRTTARVRYVLEFLSEELGALLSK